MKRKIHRLEITSKRTGKKIKHIINNPDYMFYGLTDERMRDIALGVVYGLMGKNLVNVQVFKRNEQGDFIKILAVG